MGEKIIPEGVIIYSKIHKLMKLGVGKIWDETPVLLNVGVLQTVTDSYEILSEDFYLFKQNTEVRLTDIEYKLDNIQVGNADTLQGHPASDFAMTQHTHVMGDIDELIDALSSKAALSHTHNLTEINNFVDGNLKIKVEYLPDVINGGNAFSN